MENIIEDLKTPEMVEVVGVRFKKAGKIYYFDPDNLNLPAGTDVIVETSRGVEFGKVELPKREVSEEQVVQPLKKVLRAATDVDVSQNESNKAREQEAFGIALSKIEKHNLDMKLVDVELTFDLNKIIFYFTADGRVDFRELVKELAHVFRMRIELRQVGVRDEAKILNGIGICGRCLCCATFLDEFQPVSIKMAKEQSLSLNPTKISGICGRLMCCLKYEEETYEALNQAMPNVGAFVKTPDGDGEVISTSLLRQLVSVAVKKQGDNPTIVTHHVDKISRLKREHKCQKNCRHTESNETKTGDTKSGDTKSGESRTGESKTGESRTSEPKTGEPKTGEPKTVESKTSEPNKTHEPQ